MNDRTENIGEMTNTIHNRNCIEGMKDLPENSVDLIIADPPYNLSKGNNWEWDNESDIEGFGGEWEKTMENWDQMGLGDYISFTTSWLSQAERVLKPSGSIWTFGSYHNIGVINLSYQTLGIEILNEIIWYKRNAFPNLSGRRFTASHETILWGHTGDEDNREYTFNYELLKEMELEEDNLNDGGKQVRTVWDIPNNKSKQELEHVDHPTQKPLRVLERIMLASTKKGDLCLVPFCGSGSACVSAKLNDRRYIGFDIEEEYIEMARTRIRKADEKPEQIQRVSGKDQARLSDKYE